MNKNMRIRQNNTHDSSVGTEGGMEWKETLQGKVCNNSERFSIH